MCTFYKVLEKKSSVDWLYTYEIFDILVLRISTSQDYFPERGYGSFSVCVPIAPGE